jgi:hypothetical protein
MWPFIIFFIFILLNSGKLSHISIGYTFRLSSYPTKKIALSGDRNKSLEEYPINIKFLNKTDKQLKIYVLDRDSETLLTTLKPGIKLTHKFIINNKLNLLVSNDSITTDKTKPFNVLRDCVVIIENIK